MINRLQTIKHASKSRLPNVILDSSSYLREVQAINKGQMIRFFSNNDILLRSVGKSRIEQCREMRLRGSNITDSSISMASKGNYFSRHQTWFNQFCLYWSIPLEVMIGNDFSVHGIPEGVKGKV